jgi:outer membrane lipoprotein-sorting protein
MDALALLESVGETYAKLSSFEVEILFTSESGDEDNFNRSSQRARAYFSAPDKVRIEQGGARGTVTVIDGTDIHNYFARMKRYSKNPLQPGFPLAGSFHPDFPAIGGTTFLFRKIAEKVLSAEIVREDEDARVVVVAYEPPPHQFITSSPVTFWVDRRTNLIARMEGEVSHRHPAHDEINSSRNILFYTHVSVDQEIPAATFDYEPPPDAVDESQEGCGISGGGGGGFASHSSDGKQGVESWHSSRWKGDTFVEEGKLRIRGVQLSFERRLDFVDEDLRISETITGPRGTTEHEISIPL